MPDRMATAADTIKRNITKPMESIGRCFSNSLDVPLVREGCSRAGEIDLFMKLCHRDWGGADSFAVCAQSEAFACESLGHLAVSPWNCNPTAKLPSGRRWQ